MASEPVWCSAISPVRGGIRHRLQRNGRDLSFRNLFDRFENDDGFCCWYSDLLAAARPRAFFWEHPPLHDETIDRAAEFVLIDAPALAREVADPAPFAGHFAAAGQADVAVFANLGGDALLLAPCPKAATPVYSHLAAFVRDGPADQVRALWREVAGAARRLAGATPFWLSTSGLGVPWLHLRFDRVPKYYQHVEYRLSD